MIYRYLGNKTVLLEPIMAEVERRYAHGSTVFDAFSGSLAVSLELKRRGYNVYANDINAFSAAIGRAYLENNTVPRVPLNELVGRRRVAPLRQEASGWLDELTGRPGFEKCTTTPYKDDYRDLLAVLLFLQGADVAGLPPQERHTCFFDTYTEAGANSSFQSSRGAKGKRRFFSPENGMRIDAIQSWIRHWRSEGVLQDPLYSLLLSATLRAVEKVSNTQGTYHDFPRDRIDPRANASLQFEPPALDVVLAGGRHRVGDAEDTLDFVQHIPDHEVMYIDPPYNFRQYTSYYFLLNVLARFPELPSPDDYFANVRYVRGQNMEDDFSSTFCSKRTFIPGLHELIEKSRAKTVILSYFDGRNHWNEFKTQDNGQGLRLMKEFFASDLFRQGSVTVVPVEKMNYQSYGGFKAATVLEYLFVADKQAESSVAS